MKRSILSICILLASVSLVFANIYKKYDVRSGLSGNCVRSILQDSIGYMWFATQDGLNRFNGIEFTNYGHSSENGGNSYMNIVTICRHQDNNQIWVASTEKLYLFDSREEKFSVFDTQTEDGVTVNSVFGMAYDNDRQLWIGTTNGLFVYNEKKGTLKQYLHSLSDPHSLPDNHVGDLQRLVRNYLDRYPEWFGEIQPTHGQLHRVYIRGHFFRTSCLQRDYLFDGKFAGSIMGGHMVRRTGTVQ